MTQATTLAFPQENLVGWERAMYAFLVEKQRRSGSDRTVQGYSSMLQDFFGRLGKAPDKVTVQEVFHGKGSRCQVLCFPCFLLRRPAPRVVKTKTMLPRALFLDVFVVRCMLRSEPVQRCNLMNGLPVALP
jgi:hypothetical protein